MNSHGTAPIIFNYLDYRVYLQDYLYYIRKSQPAFSFKRLVSDFGFKSRSHLIDTIKGRPLSARYMNSYLQFCGLANKEADYFIALVVYRQAKTDEKRTASWRIITQLSPNLATVQLENEAYEYFSEWYIPVMVSVLDLDRSQKDHRIIAKRFKPPILAVHARRALETLTRLGFISWNAERSEWNFEYKFFSCTTAAQELALKKFHQQILDLGMQAYREDFEKQLFSTLTISISQKTRSEIVKMVTDLRTKILQMAKEDTVSEVAVQLNMQLFDVSGRSAKPDLTTKGHTL